MQLNEALSKSKIAMLRLSDRLVLVAHTAAYEAKLKDKDSWIFNDFKTMRNNDIPSSDEWEALGYGNSCSKTDKGSKTKEA